MEILEAIRSKALCQSYRTDPVSSDLLIKLVEAGRLTSQDNEEDLCEFVVVTDVSTLRELSQMFRRGKIITQAAAGIAIFCKKKVASMIEEGFGALINILLAATGMGLGTCWMTATDGDSEKRIEARLNVPEDMKLICLVTVGFPATEADPKSESTSLSPLSTVLHWQRF